MLNNKPNKCILSETNLMIEKRVTNNHSQCSSASSELDIVRYSRLI